MRVLVTGSTAWTNADAIRRVLARFPTDTVIVTGDTPGVDAIAIHMGAELGLRVTAMRKTQGDAVRYPGESWKGLNERMIASGISRVLAFHPDLGKPHCARGTQHAIDLASALGIPVEPYLE